MGHAAPIVALAAQLLLPGCSAAPRSQCPIPCTRPWGSHIQNSGIFSQFVLIAVEPALITRLTAELADRNPAATSSVARLDEVELCSHMLDNSKVPDLDGVEDGVRAGWPAASARDRPAGRPSR